ncbi:MAG TPA: hypothetical protein PKL85_12085, partial [Bacteroidia bacterium]|nr:hypothetical protein [Bacteroidia bacterium]
MSDFNKSVHYCASGSIRKPVLYTFFLCISLLQSEVLFAQTKLSPSIQLLDTEQQSAFAGIQQQIL